MCAAPSPSRPSFPFLPCRRHGTRIGARRRQAAPRGLAARAGVPRPVQRRLHRRLGVLSAPGRAALCGARLDGRRRQHALRGGRRHAEARADGGRARGAARHVRRRALARRDDDAAGLFAPHDPVGRRAPGARLAARLGLCAHGHQLGRRRGAALLVLPRQAVWRRRRALLAHLAALQPLHLPLPIRHQRCVSWHSRARDARGETIAPLAGWRFGDCVRDCVRRALSLSLVSTLPPSFSPSAALPPLPPPSRRSQARCASSG